MAGLFERIETGTGQAVLTGTGVPVGEILARLEEDESPAQLAAATKLGSLDLIAALAFGGLGGNDSDGPPLVQAEPGQPKLAQAIREEALAELVPNAARTARLSLAAGLYQILDFWEDSHKAAQEADDLGERAFSAYWHGIAHRREPDPGNAAYWFRRVGRHSIFPSLAEAARSLLDAHGNAALAAKLCPRSGWDPYAMIDLCAGARPGSPIESLARRLQRLEMIALLCPTAAAAGFE
jgi:Protein of unknown function (DUF433)